MDDILLPEWLIGRNWLVGFEGDDDGSSGDDDGNSGDDDSNDDDGDNPDDDTDEDGDDDEDEDGKPSEKTVGDVKRLEKALKDARREARTAKREARLATKNKQTADKTKQANEAAERATQLEEKLAKTAAKLKVQAIEAIGKDIARELKFRDADDALAELRRFSDDDLGVDQDPDEPEDVEVDKDVIREKLEALAERKKYLIQGPTVDDENPTGSSFSGGNGKGGKKATEQRLKETYSGLNL